MRKRLTMVLTLLTVFSLVLAGCGGVQTGAQDGEKGIDENQELNMTFPTEPPTLDSSLASDAYSFDILNNVMEGLYRLNKDNKPEPAMASSVDISDDKTTYTFSLRDANWSNGEPVTAHDFEYAWKRTLNPETKAEYSYILYPVKNAEAYNTGEASADDVGVKAVDEKTLEVQLEAPSPYFLSLTAFATYLPLNESAVEEFGNKYGTEADQMVFNGPYDIAEWKHEQSIQLKKSKTYWDRNVVRLETVNLNIVKDTATGVNLYTGNQVDVAELSSSLAEAFQKSPEYLPFTGAATQYLVFNTNNDFLSNENVRKAISFAIDRESLVKIMKDGSEPAFGFVPPSIFTSDNQVFRDVASDGHQYSPQEAQRMLKEGMEELGFSTTPRITLLSYDDERRQAAVFMQEQLRNNLDLDVQIDPKPFKQKLDRELAGDFEITFAGWGADYNDPQTFLDIYVSDGPYNWADWSSKEYDELIQKSKGNTNNEERTQNFVEAEKLLLDEAPIAPILYRGKIFLQKQYVKNIYRHPVGAELSLKWAYIDGKE
ncbi:peptide ABC transporter substrate-binding protein [Desmospora profundinema]|uniref:Oligopeptide transport system substrate-binding protein n=1 Tax=Desmospora profundinema TaxID=1571184 RepID=A0ABU1IP29_9BACL|nr:peptide ABC transporter substrate-binding protein [Desmospora profundinema]MDR6226282.1 oligopeptide transport system substrate-binding protein [Desmospora profundinema]